MIDGSMMLVLLLVDHLQHQIALEGMKKLGPNLRELAFVLLGREVAQASAQILVAELGLGLQPFADVRLDLVLRSKRALQRRYVPLLLDRFRGDVKPRR